MKILMVSNGWRNRNYWLLVFFLWTTLSGHAQYYSSGQDPASITWQQINTANFKVIYPLGYERTANYVANVLEYARDLDTISLSANPKKIPVILHNRTAISNASVVWAPRRMEFYTIPPQDSYGQEWFQQLALHEYRHVIQMSKLNQGLTKVLTWLFGEQATAAVFGLYVPFWFIEGDAVAAETALSKTGRGRAPSFSMPLRAQVLEKGKYKYDKAVFGSYKDFVPNHYILGYHLVAQARKDYGIEIWDHTIDKVGKKPWMIVPFSEGGRDVSDLTKTKLYKSSMNQLMTGWEKQVADAAVVGVSPVPVPPKKQFTNYIRPFYTSGGTIIAEKKPLDDIARFVEIDREGNERIIFTPGYYYSGSLTYANGLMAWVERKYDLRWQNRNYAVIKIFDINTRKSRTLTSGTRYFAPSFSKDGKSLVAVEVTEKNQYNLVIVDVATGETVKRISTPENYFLTYPNWSEDGDKIVSIVIGDKGKSIALFDVGSDRVEYMTEFSYTDISKAVMRGNQVLFVGSWSGIENLYVLDIQTRRISKLSSVPFGVTDPQFSSDGNLAICANYTSDGFEIAEVSLVSGNWLPVGRVQNRGIKLYETLAQQDGNILDPEKIPDTNYQTKKYSKLKNLFNIHSWAPLSINANNLDVNPGVSILSQNLLSSSFTTLGYEWNINEGTGKYYLNYSYQGWYPILDFQADWGRRKSFTHDTAGHRQDFSWMETNFSTAVRAPFNLTSGKYSRLLQPSVEFTYQQLDMDDDALVSFKRTNFKTLNYRLYFSNFIKSVSQDMYPRWGQAIDLNVRSAPFQNDTLGSMFAVATRFYFPGIIRHHSFNIYAAYQKRFGDTRHYSTIVRYPRGFTNQFSDELASFFFNYKFPIFYPDFSLSSLAYLKRVKANLFFDYATGSYQGQHTIYRSTGIDLLVDLHIIRFLAPFELGCRLIYLPDYSDFKAEFLFSININSTE
jgi:hypothetical protein